MDNILLVKFNVTLEHIINLKPKSIYFGIRTCWWTHDPNDLQRGAGWIPTDPRGGVLLKTDKPSQFFAKVMASPGNYGRHGLYAFIAAHHQNSFNQKGEHWCSPKWEDYNRALDILKNQKF